MRRCRGPVAGALRRGVHISALFVGAFGGWFSSEPRVKALTPTNFDEFIKAHNRSFVEVYSPFCVHCKELAPKFEEAAKQFKDSGVSFAKVDANEHKEFMQKMQIKGLPHLMWMEQGQRTEYEGDRTVEDLVAFVRFMSRPTVTEVGEPAAPWKIPNFVLRAPSLTEGFRKVAEAARPVGAFYFVKDTTGKPTVAVQHRNEEPIVIDSDGDEASVDAFVQNNQLPLFGLLDTETYQRYEGRGLIWSLFPVNKRGGGNVKDAEAQHRPMMTAVAKRFIQNYSVVFTDTEAYREQLYNMLGVRRVPAIVVQPRAGSLSKYVYNGEMTEAAISKFIQDSIDGKVVAAVKSEPVPASNDGPIKIFVGNTIHEEAFKPDRDVLVEFYAPWCGACKAFEPEYKKLAQYVRQWELEDHITIAKMDATANDAPEAMPLDSYPTMYFVPAGTKVPIKFDGTERTSKSVWQWMKRYSMKADAIKERQSQVRRKKGTSKEL